MFAQAQVNALFAEVQSACQGLGLFEVVATHEPKSAPQEGLYACVWIDSISPAARASGLSATSGVVMFNIRIYTSMLSQPYDLIDPALTTAAMAVLGAFTGEFTLGSSVRDIDLLGMYGTPMEARAGYVDIDRKFFRIYTITLPVVVNDLFAMEA